MPILNELTLPLHDPILIFSLVLFIILMAPIILKRFKIPGIIGLILAGVAIGPNGFNILYKDASITLFGTVGLIYIMFIAGLDIDFGTFNKFKYRSIIFGLLTFLIPVTVGTIVAKEILKLDSISSIMVAIMFSTQTLVAYPIVSRLGILKIEAVSLAISGTIITDTLVLLVLSVISNSVQGQLTALYWVQLIVSLTLFSLIILWFFPRLTRWFFANVTNDGGSQFIFVLSIVFMSAFLAQVAGIEGIIGAFLAGLALNKIIPHTSALMNRINFVGYNIFIPFFLIGVGMTVDLRVLFNGWNALYIASILITTALFTKWLAAFITGKLFNYSKAETQLLFGLSSAHAAATLAIILVGIKLNLIDETILNGTILVILVSCLVSSFVTENAGRAYVILNVNKRKNITDEPERILLPLGDEEEAERLIDLAILLKDPESKEAIYTLSVVHDDAEAKEKILRNTILFNKASNHAAASDTKIENISRIDLNIANGISKATKELLISEIVMGWNDNITAVNKLFGSTMDNLLNATDQMIVVSKTLYSMNQLKNIYLVVPINAELEQGFYKWLKTIKSIAANMNSEIHVYCHPQTQKILEQAFKKMGIRNKIKYSTFLNWQNLGAFNEIVGINDLFILILSRSKSISYHHSLEDVPNKLSKSFEAHSFMLIYPEQNPSRSKKYALHLEGLSTEHIQENIERINKLKTFLAKIFKK